MFENFIDTIYSDTIAIKMKCLIRILPLNWQQSRH